MKFIIIYYTEISLKKSEFAVISTYFFKDIKPLLESPADWQFMRYI